MLKISYAGCFGLSSAILSQFSVEMSATSKNCEKFTKNLFLEGGSRSSMFTNLKSLPPVLVMISSKSVSICNRFHTIRANNDKMTSFRGYPSLTPSFEGNPLIQGHEILSRKPRHLEAAHGEDFVILSCTVLIQITSVMDGQADRRLDDG